MTAQPEETSTTMDRNRHQMPFIMAPFCMEIHGITRLEAGENNAPASYSKPFG